MNVSDFMPQVYCWFCANEMQLSSEIETSGKDYININKLISINYNPPNPFPVNYPEIPEWVTFNTIHIKHYCYNCCLTLFSDIKLDNDQLIFKPGYIQILFFNKYLLWHNFDEIIPISFVDIPDKDNDYTIVDLEPSFISTNTLDRIKEKINIHLLFS